MAFGRKNEMGKKSSAYKMIFDNNNNGKWKKIIIVFDSSSTLDALEKCRKVKSWRGAATPHRRLQTDSFRGFSISTPLLLEHMCEP